MAANYNAYVRRQSGANLTAATFFPHSFELPDISKPVSVEFLDTKDAQESPLFETYCLLKVLKVSFAKNAAGSSQSKLTQTSSFDRHFTCMCLHSSPGKNGLMLLVGTGTNEKRMFDCHVDGRDYKNGFGPGAVIVVVNPRPIEMAFGSDSSRIPILNYDGGLVLVDQCAQRLSLTSVPSDKSSDKMSGFIFAKAEIHLLQSNICQSKCKGWLCDAAGNVVKIGDKAIESNVVSDGQDAVIMPEYFSSRSLTETVLKGGFPHDDCLDLSITKRSKINTAYNAFFEAGNTDTKWTVSGWYRRCLKEDAASAAGESATDHKYSKKVASSELTYHISSIRYNGLIDSLEKHFVDATELVLSDDKRARTSADEDAQSLVNNNESH
eukprot:scaffold5671_cov36-Cyclotella_meneghiniana.AAC.2